MTHRDPPTIFRGAHWHGEARRQMRPREWRTDHSEEALCARCGEPMPTDVFGALSRVDNESEICSDCGLDEAIGRGLAPTSDWPIGPRDR
jgi:hypothetical protein